MWPVTLELERQTWSSRALDALLDPAAAIAIAWIAALALILHLDPFLATLSALGALGAFTAGLTGVGGAIVMIPLLLYVPPWIGTGQLSVHQVAAITMVQVFAGAASGMAGHMRGGFVNRRVATVLGAAMAIGSLGGAVASRWVSGDVLRATFAGMAALGAVVMLVNPKSAASAEAAMPDWSAATGFLLAFIIGSLAGAVGAGGAFLLMPMMLYVLRIPQRLAVGSSLAVALVSSALGLTGKIVTGQVMAWPALALVAGALPAAQLGAAASKRMPARQVRTILALLVAAVAVKMWLEILR